MPDAHDAKAEEMVSPGVEGGTGRDAVVDAVAADLRTAAADEVVRDDQLATLQTQALALSDAVEVIAETAASVASEIEAIKDGITGSTLKSAVDDAAADWRSSPDEDHRGNWGRLPTDTEAAEASATHAPPSGEFLQRYVDVLCPSGKHPRSMLTFRSHEVASLFCIPCQRGWTESTTHPALRDLSTDSPR